MRARTITRVFGTGASRGYNASYNALSVYGEMQEKPEPLRRRGPSALEWRCGCGRIHRRGAEKCPLCGEGRAK